MQKQDVGRRQEMIVDWPVFHVVERSGTWFSFEGLQPIRGRRPQDLRLQSTGQNIAPGFIRPYTVCVTPDFIC